MTSSARTWFYARPNDWESSCTSYWLKGAHTLTHTHTLTHALTHAQTHAQTHINFDVYTFKRTCQAALLQNFAVQVVVVFFYLFSLTISPLYPPPPSYQSDLEEVPMPKNVILVGERGEKIESLRSKVILEYWVTREKKFGHASYGTKLFFFLCFLLRYNGKIVVCGCAHHAASGLAGLAGKMASHPKVNHHWQNMHANTHKHTHSHQLHAKHFYLFDAAVLQSRDRIGTLIKACCHTHSRTHSHTRSRHSLSQVKPVTTTTYLMVGRREWWQNFRYNL